MTFRTTIYTLVVSILFIITTSTALAFVPDEQVAAESAPVSSGAPSTAKPSSSIKRKHRPGELLIKFKEGVQGNAKLGIQNALNTRVQADSDRHWSRAHGLGVSEARHFKSLKKKREVLYGHQEAADV